MVELVEKYTPLPIPSDPADLPLWLEQELGRIARLMRGRDEVVCGNATFSAATTVQVTFAREQPDTNYHVVLGPRNSSQAHWVSTRLVTGFIINVSSTTSTNCAWAVFRDRDND